MLGLLFIVISTPFCVWLHSFRVIKFWDTRKTYSGLKKMVPVSTLDWPKPSDTFKGYISMCLDQQNNLFASSCNQIFKFNLSSKLGSEEPGIYYKYSFSYCLSCIDFTSFDKVLY